LGNGITIVEEKKARERKKEKGTWATANSIKGVV